MPYSVIQGQTCSAGSRIFVQEGIYDEFLGKFTATAAYLTAKTGDPFDQGTEHGPQISKTQFDVRPCRMAFNSFHIEFFFYPASHELY